MQFLSLVRIVQGSTRIIKSIVVSQDLKSVLNNLKSKSYIYLSTLERVKSLSF